MSFVNFSTFILMINWWLTYLKYIQSTNYISVEKNNNPVKLTFAEKQALEKRHHVPFPLSLVFRLIFHLCNILASVLFYSNANWMVILYHVSCMSISVIKILSNITASWFSWIWLLKINCHCLGHYGIMVTKDYLVTNVANVRQWFQIQDSH